MNMSSLRIRNKSVVATSIILIFQIIFLSNSIYAGKLNLKELEEKARKYTGNNYTGNFANGSNNPQNSALGDLIQKAPEKRDLEMMKRPLTKENIRHCQGQMINANRNFRKKNYDKAQTYLDKVFDVQPDHSGARFMRAVISARKNDYKTAWLNIIIAEEKDPKNPKIQAFVKKLESVSPRPKILMAVYGIYRPMPVSACEMASDLIERILQEKFSEPFTNISTEEFISEGTSVWVPLIIKSSEPIDESLLTSTIKKVTQFDVKDSKLADDKKSINLKFEVRDLPILNQNFRPVAGYRDYIKIVSEETDMAISNTAERDLENKKLECTYDFSVRTYKNLNDFFRKLSPYSHKFRVVSIKLDYIPNKKDIIWKGKAVVLLQTE